MIMRHKIRACNAKACEPCICILDIIANYVHSYYKVHDLCGCLMTWLYDVCIIICGVDDKLFLTVKLNVCCS